MSISICFYPVVGSNHPPQKKAKIRRKNKTNDRSTTVIKESSNLQLDVLYSVNGNTSHDCFLFTIQAIYWFHQLVIRNRKNKEEIQLLYNLKNWVNSYKNNNPN